jgi:hypothetical protein
MTQSGQQGSLIPLRGICTACGESSDWVDIVVRECSIKTNYFILW